MKSARAEARKNLELRRRLARTALEGEQRGAEKFPSFAEFWEEQRRQRWRRLVRFWPGVMFACVGVWVLVLGHGDWAAALWLAGLAFAAGRAS